MKNINEYLINTPNLLRLTLSLADVQKYIAGQLAYNLSDKNQNVEDELSDAISHLYELLAFYKIAKIKHEESLAASLDEQKDTSPEFEKTFQKNFKKLLVKG